MNRRVLKEAWLAGFLILGVLWLAKQTAARAPGIGSLILTAAVAAQLYGPILRVGKRGVTWNSLGLRADRLRRDGRSFALASLVTLPLYALGFHFWQTYSLGRTFVFGTPPGFWLHLLTQTVVLALAEEVFFRGYLQERFDTGWGRKMRRIWGAEVGWGLFAASAFFAVAHFVGEWNPARLGPFFPSLVFGWLRARTGTVVSATAYHTLCNALADVLFASYR
ncbi:MAG: myxosortase family intramembrane protease [Myxococcota bacterium]